MALAARLSPPNSMLFIADSGGGGPSSYEDGKLITANPGCITVCCLMELDGPTEVAMGPPQEVAFGGEPAFDGILETPSCSVTVSTVEWQTILEVGVPNTKTRVRIWVNHPTEPDKIGIGLD